MALEKDSEQGREVQSAVENLKKMGEGALTIEVRWSYDRVSIDVYGPRYMPMNITTNMAVVAIAWLGGAASAIDGYWGARRVMRVATRAVEAILKKPRT